MYIHIYCFKKKTNYTHKYREKISIASLYMFCPDSFYTAMFLFSLSRGPIGNNLSIRKIYVHITILRPHLWDYIMYVIVVVFNVTHFKMVSQPLTKSEFRWTLMSAVNSKELGAVTQHKWTDDLTYTPLNASKKVDTMFFHMLFTTQILLMETTKLKCIYSN